MENLLFGMGLTAILTLTAVFGLAGSWDPPAADIPQAEITNGELRVKLYLPDARQGYYPRDSLRLVGVIAALEYKSHNYYGPWYNRIDPGL